MRTHPPTRPSASGTSAPTRQESWRDLVTAWQNWGLWQRLLSLTIPLGFIIGLVLAGRYGGYSTSIAFPRPTPLAAWTWALCPLAGLLILRLIARDRLSSPALLAGFIAGGACGMIVRSGVFIISVLPVPVKSRIDLNWGLVWVSSALLMLVVAPLVALYWERIGAGAWGRVSSRGQGGREDTPAHAVSGCLMRLADRRRNSHYDLMVALLWGLVGAWTMLLTGTIRGLWHPATLPRAEATTITLGVLVGIVVLGAVAGVGSVTVANRWRLGPYAATIAFIGYLSAICLGGSLFKAGVMMYALTAAGTLILPALALVVMTLVARAAPVGTKGFDFAVAAAVGVAVIFLAFILTPQLQVAGISTMLKQGRRPVAAHDMIRTLHGGTGIRVLLQLLEHNDQDIRKQAEQRLAELGKSDPRSLLAALPGATNYARCVLVDDIAESGDRRIVQPLIRLLQQGLRPLKHQPTPAAATGSAPTKPARPRPSWLPRFSRPSPQQPTHVFTNWTIFYPGDPGPDGVRRAAARALGKLGDPAAVQPLIQALQDRDDGVRAGAAHALAELKPAIAAEPLRKALGDTARGARAAAAKALGEMRYQPAVPELLAMLNSDPRNAGIVAEPLANLGVRQAIPRLTEILSGPHADGVDQEACLKALLRLGAPTFEPLFATTLAGDKWSPMRQELKKRHADQAVTRLAPMLDDPAKQAEAAELLRFMNTDAARQALSKRGLAVSRY